MIKIYSKSYCPFCDAAKTLFTSLKVPYEEIDLTNDPDLMIEISQKSGMQTVPQIFYNDELLGGYSEVEKLHREGKLLEKINK